MNNTVPETPQKNSSAWIRLAEASQILRWIQERAWPLGGGIILISVLYLHHYIQVEKVPLNITSPSVLTGYLPVVMAILTFILITPSILVLMPASILLAPINPAGDRLIELWISSEKNSREGIRQRLRFLILWLFGLLVFSVPFAIVILTHNWESFHPVLHKLLFYLLTITSLIFCMTCMLIMQKKLKWKDISSEFWITGLIGSAAQLVSFLFIFFIAFKFSNNSYLVLLFILIILIATLAIIQIACAYNLARIKKFSQPIATFGLIGLFLIVIPVFIPPISGKLAGYVLQAIASGGKSCTVLSWPPDTKHIEKPLQDISTPSQSKPLRILAMEDGQYLVRLLDKENTDVYFLPRSYVTGIKTCKQD